MPQISIIIITHNAPSYVDETLTTLHDITAKDDLEMCEIIVVDNASGDETKNLLKRAKQEGRIDKLFFSERNTPFAGGNNLGAGLADKDSELLLLLNSDISIKNPNWLRILVDSKQLGGYLIASYGQATGSPKRADGFCFLIDRDLYNRYLLDENYEWFWSITKIQSQILQQGGKILALGNHDHLLVHYGGKSGKDFVGAKGMDINIEEVLKWFDNASGRIVFNDAPITGIQLLQETRILLNKCKSQQESMVMKTRDLFTEFKSYQESLIEETQRLQKERQNNLWKYKKYKKAFTISFVAAIILACLLPIVIFCLTA